jgi:hypothetical protein
MQMGGVRGLKLAKDYAAGKRVAAGLQARNLLAN